MSSPLNLLKIVTVFLGPSPYIIDLAESTEELSSHVTMKYVARSSTSTDEPYPITAHTENLSSTRDAEDHRTRYFRGGVHLRPEVTSPSGAYGKARLMPKLTSDMETRTQTSTGRNQRTSSWLVGGRKKKIDTVIIVTNIRNIFIYVNSQWMAWLVRRHLSCSRIWVKSCQKISRNPFQMYVSESTAGLLSQLQGRTATLFAELISPVLYVTKNQTST